MLRGITLAPAASRRSTHGEPAAARRVHQRCIAALIHRLRCRTSREERVHRRAASALRRQHERRDLKLSAARTFAPLRISSAVASAWPALRCARQRAATELIVRLDQAVLGKRFDQPRHRPAPTPATARPV